MLEMEKSPTPEFKSLNAWPYESELQAYEHNTKEKEALSGDLSNHYFSSIFKAFLIMILPPFVLIEVTIIAYTIFVDNHLSGKFLWALLFGGIGLFYGWFKLLKYSPKSWFMTKKYEKVNAILESLKTEESLVLEKLIDELSERKNQYQLLAALDKFHYDLSMSKNNKFMHMVFVPALNTLKIKLIEIFQMNLKEEETKEKLMIILLEYKSFSENMLVQEKLFIENTCVEDYEKAYHNFLQKNHYQLTSNGLIEPSDYKKSI